MRLQPQALYNRGTAVVVAVMNSDRTSESALIFYQYFRVNDLLNYISAVRRIVSNLDIVCSIVVWVRFWRVNIVKCGTYNDNIVRIHFRRGVIARG